MELLKLFFIRHLQNCVFLTGNLKYYDTVLEESSQRPRMENPIDKCVIYFFFFFYYIVTANEAESVQNAPLFFE